MNTRGRVSLVVALALSAAPHLAHAKIKPGVKVIPGVPMRAQDIPPYVPPKLGEDPPPEASDVKVIKITVPEANILVRPFMSPLIGNAIEGARLPVRGTLPAKRGCSGKLWYAVEPFGWVCSREAVPTDQAPTTEQVLKVNDGERLPFRYVMVLIKEGDKIPMWASLEDMKQGKEPERQLEKGDTVAVEKSYKHDDAVYWVSVEGKVLPQKGTGQMGQGSAWHGIALDETTPLPFGWITQPKTRAFEGQPPADAKDKTAPKAELPRRTRVKILDEQTIGKKRWLKITVAAPPPTERASVFNKGDEKPAAADETPALPDATQELWVSADGINEVRLLPRPATVPATIDRWIDVDLGEQVLVAYEKDKPVFATLVSSGRAIPTPMGTYPVWAKAAAISMKSQAYEDKGYFVNKVPWSTFFQWHNAIHGAYWHDQFGVVKSHGCVNVSPLDARHVFEWVTPAMPAGWSGLRPAELLSSPYVVVRNSKAKKPFRQDRPIGPPDRDLEAARVADADKRRADEAAAAAAAAAAGTPPPAPAPTPTP